MASSELVLSHEPNEDDLSKGTKKTRKRTNEAGEPKKSKKRSKKHHNDSTVTVPVIHACPSCSELLFALCTFHGKSFTPPVEHVDSKILREIITPLTDTGVHHIKKNSQTLVHDLCSLFYFLFGRCFKDDHAVKVTCLVSGGELAPSLCGISITIKEWSLLDKNALADLCCFILDQFLTEAFIYMSFKIESLEGILAPESISHAINTLSKKCNSNLNSYAFSVPNIHWAMKTTLSGPYGIFPFQTCPSEQLELLFWIFLSYKLHTKTGKEIDINACLKLTFLAHPSHAFPLGIMWVFATVGLQATLPQDVHIETVYFLLPSGPEAKLFIDFQQTMTRLRYYNRGFKNILSSQEFATEADADSGETSSHDINGQQIMNDIGAFIEQMRAENHANTPAIASKAHLPYYFVEDVANDIYQQYFLGYSFNGHTGLPPLFFMWRAPAASLPAVVWWLPSALHSLFYDHEHSYMIKLIKTLDFVINLTLYAKSPGKLNDYVLHLKKNLVRTELSELCLSFKVKDMIKFFTKTPHTLFKTGTNSLPVFPMAHAICDINLMINQFMACGLHLNMGNAKEKTFNNKSLVYCSLLKMGIQMYGISECLVRDSLYAFRKGSFSEVPIELELSHEKPSPVSWYITNQCIYGNVENCRTRVSNTKQYEMKRQWLMYNGDSTDFQPIKKSIPNEKTLMSYNVQDKSFRTVGVEVLVCPIITSFYNLRFLYSHSKDKIQQNSVMVKSYYKGIEEKPFMSQTSPTEALSTMWKWMYYDTPKNLKVETKKCGDAFKIATLLMTSLGKLFANNSYQEDLLKNNHLRKTLWSTSAQSRWKTHIHDISVDPENTNIPYHVIKADVPVNSYKVQCTPLPSSVIPQSLTFVLAKMLYEATTEELEFHHVLSVISEFFASSGTQQYYVEQEDAIDTSFITEFTKYKIEPLYGLFKLFPNVPRSLQELIFSAKYNWTGLQVIDQIRGCSLFIYGKQPVEQILSYSPQKSEKMEYTFKTNHYILYFDYDSETCHVDNLMMCISVCGKQSNKEHIPGTPDSFLSHVTLYSFPITEYMYDKLLNNALFLVCHSPENE